MKTYTDKIATLVAVPALLAVLAIIVFSGYFLKIVVGLYFSVIALLGTLLLALVLFSVISWLIRCYVGANLFIRENFMERRSYLNRVWEYKKRRELTSIAKSKGNFRVIEDPYCPSRNEYVPYPWDHQSYIFKNPPYKKLERERRSSDGWWAISEESHFDGEY